MYDTPLTAAQILTALSEQPRTIAKLTSGLPGPRLRRAPAAGGWSLNDILAHLRSCADVWGKYIAMIVVEDHPTIRAVNPVTWIKSTDYPRLEFTSSFEAFAKQRVELISLLRSLPASGWSRSATITGGGKPRERTVLDYARWLANHERSHLRQIARLAGKEVG